MIKVEDLLKFPLKLLKKGKYKGVSLNGGTLLLDPRNIYVRDSSVGTITGDLTNVDQYADGGQLPIE